MKNSSYWASTTLVAFLGLASAVVAANEPIVEIGMSVRNDTSAPLALLSIPDAAQSAGLHMEIPLLPRPSLAPQASPGISGPKQVEVRPHPEASPTPPVSLSFAGLSDDDNASILGFRVAPSDANGDIGIDGSGSRIYYQAINLILAIYDADDGSLLFGPFPGNTLWAGFGGSCEGQNNGDPVVLYDVDAERWFVSQFVPLEGTQCVAVSVGSDPLGAYHRYQFSVTPGGKNDYVKWGIWPPDTWLAGQEGTDQGAYTFTTRDFGGAGGSFSNAAGVLEREAMLAGLPAQFVKFSNPCVSGNCVEGLLPGHSIGIPPWGYCPPYVSVSGAGFDDTPFALDGVRTFNICVDWDNIGASTYFEGPFAAGGDFDRGLGNGFSACITPVMGGEALDCLAIFTMNRAPVRWTGQEASMVLNTTVDAGSSTAGIQWFELESEDSLAWQVAQQGTYAPADGGDRWMGSIASDGAGNIALGYSVASADQFPSIRYTTRTIDSPPGVLDGGEEICHQGTGSQTATGGRWGDYTSMSVDPIEPCVFWYTAQYYETSGGFDFNTRICSFKMPECVGDAFPCDDIVGGGGRCLADGRIQYRAQLVDNSHDGETLGIRIDGGPIETLLVRNDRAQGQFLGFAAGQHTVELADPGGCHPPEVILCP